jgi:hypothetical protein
VQCFIRVNVNVICQSSLIDKFKYMLYLYQLQNIWMIKGLSWKKYKDNIYKINKNVVWLNL